MVQGLVRLILLCCLVGLAACSSRPVNVPIPMEVPPGDPLRGSAAESLWQQAVKARETGQLGAAGRYLERALFLEPESSWLYREMAELRLREGDPESAEVMAQRALRLAPRRPVYQASLWHLIASARARKGDTAGAERARREAEMLTRRQ